MSRVNNVTTSRSKLVIGRAPKSHAKDVAAPFWEQSDRGGGGRHFPCLCFSAWPHTVTWMDDKGGPTPPILISLRYYGRTVRNRPVQSGNESPFICNLKLSRSLFVSDAGHQPDRSTRSYRLPKSNASGRARRW